MVNMTPAVPSLSAEPPVNGNGTNGHSVTGNRLARCSDLMCEMLKKCLNDVINVNCHNVDIIILQWLVPGRAVCGHLVSDAGMSSDWCERAGDVSSPATPALPAPVFSPAQPGVQYPPFFFSSLIWAPWSSTIHNPCLSQSLLALRPGQPALAQPDCCREICTMTICTKFSTKL